jgi:hypothetical protein
MKKWFFAAIMCLLALPLAAQTNSSVRGGLGGVVYDSAGAVVSGLSVKIFGPQGEYTAKTDASGHYEVAGLVPGSYEVVVENAGFKKFVSSHNQVFVDHTSTLDVHLEIGAITDTVQVDAGAVQIDTESTSLNAPISDELYESLPVARNVSAIFSLAPSVVSGGGTGAANPSIGGATGLENLYLVDGVTITDQAFGGLGTYNRYFQSLGSGVNLAFIKEVDVKTGGFEPKYGRADGGIVEIVTKSGSNRYHGALAAYMGPGSWSATRDQPSNYGWQKQIQPNYLSNPQYDVAAEFGGPVPGMKGKMFFFGAFDPTLNQDIAEAPSGAPLAGHGPYAYSTTTLSWAGKLTWQPFANTQLEASSFGDPAHHNEIPGPTWFGGLQATNADSVGTGYNFGSRDSVARLSTSITPTWTAMGVFTYNFNHFDQSPLHNNYQVSDRTFLQNPQIVTSYIGGYEPTKNDDYSLNAETQKQFHFLGGHSLSVGYSYDHTNFLDQPTRTGALYAIPGANAAGTDMHALFGAHASAIGQMTNATFRMFKAGPGCTYCATIDGTPVYLQQVRGTYKGLSVAASSHYQVGWVNDSYKMNRHVDFNAGLRWEQQWYDGDLLRYLFNDNWSPRLGVSFDPWGDQKTKAFFNYARYQLVLPLDAAIRQLGNEQDDTNMYYTPDKNPDGSAKLDKLGAPVVVPDAAHLLNGLPGKTATGSFGTASFGSSTGEGILPKTKMEYENEFVLGIQREITTGNVIEARYSDRRLGRIVEDIGSQSPEGSNIDNFYNGGIANVTAATDISVNEHEVTYTPAQWAAANPGSATPGASTAPGTNPDTDYVAPVAGCTYGNDAMVANGDFFYNYAGQPYNGACITNLDTAAGGNPDGKPDGFANPIRRYQELVLIYTRNLSHHWQGRANYRYAKLWGNYEGLFRNDNGQSDPGISSLFDFTNGALGLLGDQTKPGFLNTDRRNVFNLDFAYTIGKDSAGLSALNKMTTSMNIRAAEGNPLSAYASHPIYQNTGEVPIGGRGTKGNLPPTYTFDWHVDYPVQVQERYTLKLAFDTFNIFNVQKMTGKNQNLDLSPGAPSPDYGRPTGFQSPFYARASVRLEF